MVSLTRRGALAAAASVTLAGCGATSKQGSAGPRDITDAGHKDDVELLTALLTLKAQAAASYHSGRGKLLARLAQQEDEHAHAVERAIRAAGGKPPNAFTLVHAGEPLAQAHTRELTMIALGIDALPKLADPKLRVLLSSILTSDGEHLAAITLAQGGDPVPEAFIYGAHA